MTRETEIEALDMGFPTPTVHYVAERGKRTYRVQFSERGITAKAAKAERWVAGTPLHVRAPDVGFSKEEIRLSPSSYEAGKLSWDSHRQTPQHRTTLGLVRDTLVDAIKASHWISAHGRLQLLEESERYLAFIDQILTSWRDHERRKRSYKLGSYERAGATPMMKSPPDGTRVRIVNPEYYNYMGAHPTGIFVVERCNGRVNLRGLEGVHRGSLLIKAKGMLLTAAEPESNQAQNDHDIG